MARLARITTGFGLIIAGIFMLVLPGPGILTIVAGLALLSRDMVWAGRLSDWVKQRFARYAGTEGSLPGPPPSSPALGGETPDQH